MSRPLIALYLLAGIASAQDARVEFFEKKIRPVLAAQCYVCHSAQAPQIQGGLRLDTPSGLRRGGNSGPPITPGDPDASILIRALRHTDSALKMPPGAPLEPEIVRDFEEWVRMGAPDPRQDADSDPGPLPKRARKHWAFQPPRQPPLPPVRNQAWVRNPVDRFILAKLEEKGIKPSPEADKRTLLRRLSYAITGLPPSWKQVRDFLADDAPDAYEIVVERWLGSPHYGERWARHWMDVARYADTYDGGRRFPFAYTYRDWLVHALNADMPYDEFVRKQLAADLLPRTDDRDLAALGFVTLGRSVPKGEHDMIDDRIDVITRGFLGLTVTCARCHDHKYDPILTREYYSLYGMIKNSPEPTEYPVLGEEDPADPLTRRYRQGMERRLRAIDGFITKRHAELVAEFRSAAWLARYMLAAERAAKFSNTEMEKLSRERDYNLFVLSRWRDYFNRLRRSDDAVFALWRAYASLGPKDFASKAPGVKPAGNPLVSERFSAGPPRSMEEVAERYAELLAKVDRPEPYTDPHREALRLVLRAPDAPTNVARADFDQIRGPGGDANIIRGLRRAVRAWQAECAFRGLTPRAMSIRDSPQPEPAFVFVRGNPNNKGAPAPRRFLATIAERPQEFDAGSGRLAVAEAIASARNPLTARVIVNRVWGWHFGRGLVATPSDFGTRGDPPTHPELLDYLATRFMNEGWSLKKLHRWIVLSSTYRQASADRPAARAQDPENTLLWRMNRQRLDFESLRDSILSVSGRLETQLGGLPFSLEARPAVPRRTMYAYLERGRLPGELYTFDFAKTEAHQPQRVRTTVPQQALYLMNSPFMIEQVQHLAGREEIQAARDNAERVRRLYRTVYQREPGEEELRWSLEYLSSTTVKDTAKHQRGPWRYGMGFLDLARRRVADFQEFRYFEGGRWQPASLRPQPKVGSASLSANGGAPGDDERHSVIRRWIAPQGGLAAIEGTLKHSIGEDAWGDGVRAWVVHNRLGVITEAVVKNQEIDMGAEGLRVEAGDTLDFIVSPGSDPENDDFQWAPVICLTRSTWNASEDFRGPEPLSLGPWERYAQALLASHEFAFVD